MASASPGTSTKRDSMHNLLTTIQAMTFTHSFCRPRFSSGSVQAADNQVPACDSSSGFPQSSEEHQ